MMYWILIAFVSPILHAFANIIDNYLTNKLFRNVWTLAFYSSCFNVIFLPFVFIIEVPSLPPLSLLPIFFIIAIIEVIYLYPYYKALQVVDTSIVSSLFALGKVFVPIFAFFVVGETLFINQYIGFLIIIFCSALLTLDHDKGFSLNKSFYLMGLTSVLLSFEAVLYKYLFNSVGWATGFFWSTVFTLPITSLLLFVPKYRSDIRSQFKRFRNTLLFFGMEEILTFGGIFTSTYVISLIPVTIEKSVDSFQPFFTLIYAIMLSKFAPKLFKEKIDKKSLIKKFLLFIIMLFGILIIVF